MPNLTTSNSLLDELPPPPNGLTGWPWTEASCRVPETMPDGSPWPAISIVTPSYNQGEFIEAAIRSVLLQGYPNLEYIVVDGASTDETLSILQKYDPWISHWISEPDAGQAAAINKGFRTAAGRIFGWVNSDDLLWHSALQTVALATAKHSEAVAWVGRCQKVRPNRTPIETIEPRGLTEEEMGDWWNEGHFYQPSCLFDASAFRTVGGLNESLHYTMDVDLWMRLAREGEFKAIKGMLSEARVYPEAKTWRAPNRVEAEKIAINVYNGHIDIAERRLSRHVDSKIKDLNARCLVHLIRARLQFHVKDILRRILSSITP